ncbi:MAG: hypothetical protein SFY32_16980 [Bacteroidota bacterium]|nr:hypothetical protein [Bacteroidota bacterium]
MVIDTIEGTCNYEIRSNWMYAWHFAKSKKLNLILNPNEVVTINYGINQPWKIRLIFISTVLFFGFGLYGVTFVPEFEKRMGEYKFLFQISVFIIPQLILGFMNYYNRKLYIFERKSIEN